MRASAADQTLWQVPLTNGQVATGTEQELNARFRGTGWKGVARPVQRAHAPRQTQVDSDIIALTEDTDFSDAGEGNPGRLPTSSVRRHVMPGQQRVRIEDHPGTIIPRRAGARTSASAYDEPPVVVPKRRRGGLFGILRDHPIVALLAGMALMALLAWSLSALGAWWRLHHDETTYGWPRTFQVDAVVGHSDSQANPSHFIFLNLHRHVEIIELPGGDASKARIYNGPTLFGDGQELTPVTGEFRDVNGDGKPDMLVHIQDQTLVYLNDGTQFVPLRPGQQIHV